MGGMNDGEPYREFIREMTQRIERALREFAAEARRDRREAAARFEKLDAKTDQLLEESRTHTKALLAILDRLDSGGAAPASG